ncbi:MAG TPA: hypothetical protein VNO31_09015 [Umezawaea sp.]|jgi:hypothetical protein|nr:hypothetical protein [Umezawaea sp.]
MATLTPLAGPLIVDQPAVGNIRYGLFTAANGPLDLPKHGSIGGVTYIEDHCGQAHLLAAASCTGATIPPGIDTCDGVATGLPFQVQAGIKLGAVSYDAAEVERRVRVRLNDNAQYVAEQAFWGGNADVQPVLQRWEFNGNTNTSNPGILDVTPTPGTAVTIEYGVGLLEDALAQYSYPGVLHARPLITPFLVERQMMPLPQQGKSITGKQYTAMGNVWSFGRGYANAHPVSGAAAAAGTAYIAATGAVTVWKDPEVYVNPPEKSFDRSGNAWQTTAFQAYATTVDCVAFFVLVELDSMTRGTGPAATATTVY